MRPNTPEDYRPITLLNTNYKILSILIAARLRPILAELLHPSHYCGVSRNTIFDAVITIQNAIAYAETTLSPLFVVSLDFKQAFHRISHTYLLTVMRSYGFGAELIERIEMMYENATSFVQVNGHPSTTIQSNVECSRVVPSV